MANNYKSHNFLTAGLRLQRVCRDSRLASSQCHSGEMNQTLLEHQTTPGKSASYFVSSLTHSLPILTTAMAKKDSFLLHLHRVQHHEVTKLSAY